jgi:riboflavin kinase/FMN adenylyltransferase
MVMSIFRDHSDLPEEIRGGVVAIGNFDGVHQGHWAVIGEAGRQGRDLGIPFGVLTFEPHPRSVFQPECPPFRLSPFHSKNIQIEKLDADFLVALPFDRAFASISAEDFIRDILVKFLGARQVVVGYDFVFGRGRTGNHELLAQMSSDGGYGLTVIAGVTHGDPAEGGEIYASSRIREYLRVGKPLPAADRLGRWWEISGPVLPGDQRGRRLGFPTANIALNDHLEPALGVYAVRIAIEGQDREAWRGGVANLGRRPTFDGKSTLLEVHIFDFDQDIYGRDLRVAFLDFLRPEKKFDVLDALKAQITADCKGARAILADPEYSNDRFPARPGQ